MKIRFIVPVLAVFHPVAADATLVLPPGHTADWLTYSAETSSLIDCNATPRAAVTLNIENGATYFDTLVHLEFAESDWLDTIPFDASADPADVVEGFRIHVLPSLSSIRFSLTISAPTEDLYGSILMIGGLDGGSDSLLRLAASTGATLELLGFGRWDPGFAAHDTIPIWSDEDATLSPDPNVNGESAFAFFRLIGVNPNEISIHFESQHPALLGDAFVVGLALVSIPEPSLPILTGLGLIICLGSRRNR